jgi:putative ABC transport system permease protein
MQLENAWRNVSRHHRRSLVAGSALAAACFGLLFLQSFFAGLFAVHAENSIHSRFGHGQITTKGYWGQAFEKSSDHWIKDADYLLKELRGMPEVAEVFPRTQFFALLSNGNVNVAGRGQGIVGAREAAFFNKMNFIEGQALGARSDGIVVGVGLAKALGVGVGDRVTVLGQTEQGTLNAIDTVLVGIFHVGMKEADDALFQVQLDQAQTLLQSSKVESISIGLKSDDDWEVFERRVAAAHPELEALSVFVVDQAWADNGRKFLGALLQVFRLILAGMILLAVYGSSSQLVIERRREIGMLRANGESRLDVLSLFLTENVLIGLGASVVAVVLLLLAQQIAADGIPLPPTPGTNRELPVPLLVEHWDALASLSLAVGASVLACLSATWQGVRCRIADAMRTVT